ncbi:MAG TPA: hypothetical protein VL354_14410, partial [Spirochaetia bacterium]|nr:hypothetical protein [Spirochaetia bacterium]
MKNPRVSPAICLPVFLLFIVACSVPTSGGRTGSLVLEISASSSRARTITPTVDIEAASYDISGSGPGGATFGGTGLTGQTHEWSELAPGDWAVAVDARNSSGVRIGTGTRMFAISNGETTTVSLTVSPISGPGTLTVAVSWPATAVASPVVSASLAPQAGAASTIEFTMNGSAASYNNTGLEAGYYTMSLRLFDGSRLVWGRTEAVQIVAGESSAVTYALSLSDVNTEAKGGLALQVFVDLRKPFAVTLTGLLSPIPRQTDMTVTAQAEGTPDSWAWFLNGEPLPGATGPSATLGSTLSAGVYWLDVVASRAGVASSAHGVFRVDSQSAPVTPSVGDLVINEMMIDPAGVADTSGEWFELFNVSAKPLNLEGLVIRTASSFVRLDTGGSGLMI